MTSTERADAIGVERFVGQRMLGLRDLFETMSAISSVSRLDDLLPHLARIMAGSVGAQQCSVSLYDAELTAVTNHYRWGYTPAQLGVLSETDAIVGPMAIPAERHVISTRQPLQRIPGEIERELLPSNAGWREAGWRGDLIVPFIWNDCIKGVAVIHLPDGADCFDPMQIEIAQGVAQQAAGMITHLRTTDTERHTRRQTEMLLEISRVFSASHSLSEIYSVLAEGIREMLGTDAVSVVVQVTPGPFARGTTIQRVAAVGLTEDELRSRDRILESHTALGSTIDRIAGERHDPVIIDTLDGTVDDEALRENFRRHGVQELLAAPIDVGSELHGVLYSWSRHGAVRLDPGKLAITGTMVRHAAASIERVQLIDLERVQRERSEALLSFSRLLNMSASLKTVVSSIVETLERLFPESRVYVIVEDDGQRPDYAAPSSCPFQNETDLQALLKDVQWQGTVTTRIDALSVVAVPLTIGADAPGAIILVREGETALTGEEHVLFDGLASQAASAVRRARLYAVAKRHIADLTLLQEVGHAISTLQSLPEIFAYMADEILKVVKYSAGSIALDGHTDGYLETVAVWGDILEEHNGKLIPIDASIMGGVYLSHEPVVVDDVNAHPRAWGKDVASWRSMVCVPLMTGSRAIGAMLLGHTDPGIFSQEDVRLASLLAGQAGAAIYQARESERQRELYRAGVEALAAAVDAKDSYIHSHSRQVAELSRRTAETLGLGSEEVERIELAGLLHDVGKIGIPDHILTKPGRLDPQERLIMIGHATLGARIVAAHPSLSMLSNLILHHHEWHNGSGYPDGLRGDEVPLGSAIISVVDAFDSMTSVRPYRKPLTFDAARQELSKWSGTQFHPAVVDAFLETLGDETQSQYGVLLETSMKLEPIQALDVVAPRVLSQIATEISHLTDLYPFLDRVQQIICQELKYDDVHILLMDDTDGQLILAASTTHSELVGRYRVLPGDGISGHAVRSRTVINSGDVTIDPRAHPTDLGTRSMLAVPLIVDDEVIGVLGSGSTEPDRYEDRDMALMVAIAGQIGQTIRVAQIHDHAKRAATTDGLTGVMNHRAFYLRLEAMISELDHRDEDLHLLIVDVIGLKAVNDVHGHLAGDRALKAIATALTGRVRGEDEVARYGGDEFVVIVRGTPRAGLSELVDGIIAPVQFSLEDGFPMSVRLRCGVATSHSSTERATELVARADAGLYSDVRPTEREDEY